MLVDDRSRPGDLTVLRGRQWEVDLHVAAPSWVRPRRAVVYINGLEVDAVDLAPRSDGTTDQRAVFHVPRVTRHDGWLVCVVTGDGVDGPWWTSLNAFTLTATNPVWLDADLDGRYRSPREGARALLATPTSEWSNADNIVVIHALDLMRREHAGTVSSEASARLAADRPRVADWLAGLPARETAEPPAAPSAAGG